MDLLGLITLIILYIPTSSETLRALADFKFLYKIIYIVLSLLATYYFNYIFLSLNIVTLFIFYKKGIILPQNSKLLKKVNIRDSALLTAIVLGIKIGFALLNIVYIFLLEKFDIPIESQEIIKQLNQSSASWFFYLSMIIILLAPIAEEFCFRYFIYDVLLKKHLKLKKYASAAISAVIFSLLHANIAGALMFFLLGLALCRVYETKGFLASAIMHAEYNAISVISILLLQS